MLADLGQPIQHEIYEVQTNLINGLENIRNQISTNRNLTSAIAPALWLWRLVAIPKNPILELLSEREEKIVKFTRVIFEKLLDIVRLLGEERLRTRSGFESRCLNDIADVLMSQPYHRIFDILLVQLKLRKQMGNTEDMKDNGLVEETHLEGIAATHELPYETVVLLCKLMESFKEVMRKKEQEDKQSEDIQKVSEATPLLNNFNDEAIHKGVITFLWNCRELMQPWTRSVADIVTLIFGGSCCFQVLTGLDSLIPYAYLRGLLASQSFSANEKVYCGSTRALFLGLRRLFPGDSRLPVLSVHIDERWIRRPPNKYILFPAFAISTAISVAYAVLAAKGIKDSERNVASWGDYLQEALFCPVTIICMTGVQTKSIVDKLQTYFLHRELNKVNQQSASEVLSSHDHSSRIKCVTAFTVILPIVGVAAMMMAGYSQLVKKVPPILAIGAVISLLMSPFNYYNMKNFWMFVAKLIDRCYEGCKGSEHHKQEVGLKTQCLNNVSSLYDFYVLCVQNPVNNASIAMLSKDEFIKFFNYIKRMNPHTESWVTKLTKWCLFAMGFSTSEMFSMCPYDRREAMLTGFSSCYRGIKDLRLDEDTQRILKNGDVKESQQQNIPVRNAQETPGYDEENMDGNVKKDKGKQRIYLTENSGSNHSDISTNLTTIIPIGQIQQTSQESQSTVQTQSWGGWFKSWCPCFWRSEERRPLLLSENSSVQNEAPRDLGQGAC